MEQRIKELIPKDKGKSAILFEDGTEATDEADTALLPIGDGVAFSVLKGNNE